MEYFPLGEPFNTQIFINYTAVSFAMIGFIILSGGCFIKRGMGIKPNAQIKRTTTKVVLLGGAYVSFPIASLISEDSAEITVDCKWYKSTGMGWDSEIQDNEYKLTYTKGGFEHAPVSLSNKMKTNLN